MGKKHKKQESTDPVDVRVTRLKKIGWGIRIYVGESLWSQRIVKDKKDIGNEIKSDLRMIDKCGVDSPMAAASRDRFFCGHKYERNKGIK